VLVKSRDFFYRIVPAIHPLRGYDLQMASIPMTFACGLYDRMIPLATGEVKPEGIDLEFVPVHNPRDLFDRMARGEGYDAAEMSTSEYVTRFAAGQCPFVAIPAFPSRTFRHGFIVVDTRVIREPKDLEGKRVGVQLYTMTAAVWIRGLLQQDHGVDLSTIDWIEGALDAPTTHGKPTVLPPLKPVSLTANTSGKSLSALLEAGDIQAIIGAELPSCLGKAPHIARLFPDYREAEKAYWRRHGIFPVMHLVVLRRDVHERHPAAAASLFKALDDSKAIAYRRMRYIGALSYMLPWLAADIEEIDAVFGGDPWPYGVEPNRPTLEAFVQHLVDQSMIERHMQIEELFVKV
jgi:4,5-dihydroxyphthalate decarboxylase